MQSSHFSEISKCSLKRSDRIDSIRGIAMIAMTLFHICAMETIFYGYVLVPDLLFWILGKIIAIAFISVSGFVVAFGSTADM